MMKEKAKVYFSDFRALPGTSIQQKLTKLMRQFQIASLIL